MRMHNHDDMALNNTWKPKPDSQAVNNAWNLKPDTQ